MVDHICNNCFKSIKQFEEFCDAVRNVHGFTQVYVDNVKDETINEPIEYVEEELVENIEDISNEFPIKSILSIEKDIEPNSALARRPGQFKISHFYFIFVSKTNNNEFSL